MKCILLLSMLSLLSACKVAVKNEQEGSAGKLVTFSPQVVSGEEEKRIQKICHAIAEKSDRIHSYSTRYTFNYAEKSCADESMRPSRDVAVQMEDRGNGYFAFRPETADTFAFTNVETSSSGVLSEICKRPSESAVQINGGRSAQWWTTLIRSAECSSDGDHVCVHVKTGSLVSGNQFRIHTDEWIKFKVTSGRLGMFTERKLISEADCASGYTVERRAKLK